MMMSIQVLHITAHLGGGVGKALSGLVRKDPEMTGIYHKIICLEQPQKLQFIHKVQSCGTEVIQCPSQNELLCLVREADIVQVEWWGHPAVPATLCRCTLPPMRLIVWYHISGLDSPILPVSLMQEAHLCRFTSAASMQSPEVQRLGKKTKQRLGVIHSAGGIDELPSLPRHVTDPMVAGYIGSLNFSKLHPHYAKFLAQVRIPGFRVRIIGDEINRATLEKDCHQQGFPDMLDFKGYCTDIATELSAINVMPYILNPLHYGTTENALLEAMAMEVVPVVLNNPVESWLVQNGETGLIVSSPEEFGKTIRWLHDYPEKRWRIGKKASARVRERFPIKAMQEAFTFSYQQLLVQDKKHFRFSEILGPMPADWFLSNQKDPAVFLSPTNDSQTLDTLSTYAMFEKTKGSLFHFTSYFPDDPILERWKALLLEKKILLDNHRMSK